MYISAINTLIFYKIISIHPYTFLVLTLLFIGSCTQDRQPNNGIQPYHENAWYWQYQGEPVMLTGGSKDDNLFQIPNLEDHLDQMAEVGANYIRNTMSSRDTGDVRAFKQLDNGKYDLEQWNPEYWQRFKKMLQWTSEREIFVQIEFWDQWDHNSGRWDKDPWNPDQNVNYTTTNTALKGNGHYDDVVHDAEIQHDLFLTVPAVQNDSMVLNYQQKFINKVLSYTFQYDHVLYTITNELFNQHPREWSLYWINYVKEKAQARDKSTHITEMFQETDITIEPHLYVYNNPETFDFIDISQNSGQMNQQHWDNLQWVRNYASENPRPLNHTKTYGGDAVGWTDGDAHGIERFWRSIIGGAASIRFHRPPSGIGLNEKAQRQIRSAKMLLSEFDIFKARPDANNTLLYNREPDEAYLTYIQGEQYAVYFPDEGNIELDLTNEEGLFALKWLNINKNTWSSSKDLEGGKEFTLDTPGEGHWIALVFAK